MMGHPVIYSHVVTGTPFGDTAPHIATGPPAPPFPRAPQQVTHGSRTGDSPYHDKDRLSR